MANSADPVSQDVNAVDWTDIFQGQQAPVPISRNFHPSEDDPPDLIIVSEDNVSFSLQRKWLLEKSMNFFGGLLVSDGVSCFDGS
jgi:hypothetical protein